MKKQLHKPVSNLDLKLLDVKFIAIDDNRIYLTEALQSVRKAKLIEFPSLLMSKDKTNQANNNTMSQNNLTFHGDYKNQSTIESINQFDQSILSSTKFRSSEFSCLEEPPHKPSHQGKSVFSKHFEEQQDQNQIQKIKQQIQARHFLKSKMQQNNVKSLPSFSHQPTKQSSNQRAELQKYRRRIDLIKKQNLFIHKQITSLYRNKINQNKEPLKKIRKIEPFRVQRSETQVQGGNVFAQVRQNNADLASMKRTWDMQKVLKSSILPSGKFTGQTPIIVSKKLGSSPQIRQKINFYENLTEKSPYKQELQNIHKKIISNNLHKNFEQYLTGANRRVPEFIKKLRN